MKVIPIVCIKPRKRALKMTCTLEAPKTSGDAEAIEEEDTSKCTSDSLKEREARCEECTSQQVGTPSPPPKSRPRVRKAQLSGSGAGSSDSDGIVVVNRARKRRVIQELTEEVLDGDEMDPVRKCRPRRTQRKNNISDRISTDSCGGPALRAKAMRSPRETNTDVDSDTFEPRATNRRRRKTIMHFDEEENEEEERKTPMSAEKSGVQDGTAVSEESDGLQEDLEDLDQTKVIHARTRQRGKKSNFGEALEKFKVSKTHRLQPACKEQLREYDYESSDTFEESGGSLEGYDSNGDEGFVIETDGDDAFVELPAEFSINALDASHSFDTLIHCYVHGVLDPTFLDQVYNSEPDAYVRAALDAVEKRIQCYENGLVASQAWRPNFKRAMNMHPNYAEYGIDAEDGCMACGNVNRTSTVCVVLSGRAYNKKNFKVIEDNHSDHSDVSDISDGEGIHEYRIGRYCHARSKLYHGLQHMRFHFYERVEAQVEAVLQKLGEVEAKDIISEMEKSGFIRTLFSEFEGLIESAERGYACG